MADGGEGAGGGSAQETQVRQRKVEIPVRVLTADDCDAWQRAPPRPDAAVGAGTAIEFQVPTGCACGDPLQVPLRDGDRVQVAVPEGVTEGDTLRMMRRSDDSWRLVKRSDRFAFTFPKCEPGDRLRFNLPDGSPLCLEAPEGVDPGNVLFLARDGQGTWTVTGVHVLPPFDPNTQPPAWARGPYAEILRVLEERGILRRLPVGADGTLTVNTPFCGRLQEYAVLGGFLSESCLTLPGVSKVSILGAEVVDTYSIDWAMAKRWFQHVHPSIELQMCVIDLAQDPLPDAALTIGIHPEVTKGGCWFPIIGSMLRSSAEGVCIFATFFDVEKQTLLNMIDMYKDEGTTVEVMENPYYDTHEKPASPSMRFIIIVISNAVNSKASMGNT